MKRFWRFAKPLRLMLFDNHNELRWRLINMENRLMDEMEALKQAIMDLGNKIDAFLANNQADVQKLIDDAIAADDAKEAVDLRAMKEGVISILNRIPPKFEPSNN